MNDYAACFKQRVSTNSCSRALQHGQSAACRSISRRKVEKTSHCWSLLPRLQRSGKVNNQASTSVRIANTELRLLLWVRRMGKPNSSS